MRQQKQTVRWNSGRVRSARSRLPATAGHASEPAPQPAAPASHPDRGRGRVDAVAESHQQRQQTGVPLRDPASGAGHEYVPGHRRHPGQRGDTTDALALGRGCRESTHRHRQRSVGQRVLQLRRRLSDSLPQPHHGRTLLRWQVGHHALAGPHPGSPGKLSQQETRRTAQSRFMD